MVRALQPPAPSPPLPAAHFRWSWQPPRTARWQWCRVYHRGPHTSDGATFRSYGPLSRLDHHHPAGHPRTDESGREILYAGEDLATSACEVFGEAGVAAICPNCRVSIVAPTRTVSLFDLTAPGAALTIGALPSLTVGNETRELAQQWGLGPSSRTNRPDARSTRCGISRHPRILNRLQVQMRQRQIAVTTVPEARCAVCRRTVKP
jgi:hypothetical protein